MADSERSQPRDSLYPGLCGDGSLDGLGESSSRPRPDGRRSSGKPSPRRTRARPRAWASPSCTCRLTGNNFRAEPTDRLPSDQPPSSETQAPHAGSPPRVGLWPEKQEYQGPQPWAGPSLDPAGTTGKNSRAGSSGLNERLKQRSGPAAQAWTPGPEKQFLYIIRKPITPPEHFIFRYSRYSVIQKSSKKGVNRSSEHKKYPSRQG